MKRSLRCLALLCAAALGTPLAAQPASTAAAPNRRPNVLLVLVDDLKPLAGCYGDALARTPNIDRLAARGVRFDLAYCNQPVCGPSRLNLMLGSRSTSTGLYHFGRDFRRVLPDAVTLSQHFMRNGYRAESLGKVYHIGHNTHDDAASWSTPPYKDLVIEYVDPASKPAGELTREEALFANAKLSVPVRQLPRGAAWEHPEIGDDAYADGRVAVEAIRRLEAARGQRIPFFLAVGFARPHLPFSAPKKYWDMYDRSRFTLAENPHPPSGAPPFALKRLGELNQYEPIPEQPPVPEEIQRTLIHGYYASVSYADAQIGRVLDALDRLGLAENTIVLLWGDHGFSLGTHGDWTKHTNYEEANRIPLVFAGPGIKAGGQTRALAETVDIYPTLAELAGLPAPAGSQPNDGVSLVPVLRNPNTHAKDHVYHVHPRPRPSRGEWLGRAIRTERYRLVEWRPISGEDAEAELELYDYVADPLESENLARSRPEVVAALRALLARHPAAKPPVPAGS